MIVEPERVSIRRTRFAVWRPPAAGPNAADRTLIGINTPSRSPRMLDTGATVNVLPYSVGEQLGTAWERQTTSVELSGNLAACEARVLIVSAIVGGFPAVRLAFAWARTDAVPVLLEAGQLLP